MIRRWLQKVLSHLPFVASNLKYLTKQPWVVVKEGSATEKLIFRENGELLISRSGRVEEAQWEYLTDINGLLIERSEGRFLYNPSYIDQAAMIWKVDSSENEFVTLANPKFIPDLNVSSYLEKLRYKKRNILKIALENDIWMEVERNYDTPYPVVGNRVTLSGSPFPEGNYALKDDNRMLTIKNSQIHSILYKKTYFSTPHQTIDIYQQDEENVSEEDLVRINGHIPSNGYYRLAKRSRIRVEDGKVSSVNVYRPWLTWILIFLGLSVAVAIIYFIM
jgi:hypothetical protein